MGGVGEKLIEHTQKFRQRYATECHPLLNLLLLFTDIFYFAAMGKPGGGRNDVDPRFISLFNVYNITFPSEESLFLIFDSILSGHTKPFSADIRDVVNIISKITLQLYKSIIVELPPTPSKFHYIFNLRDLSRIYNGLVLTTPERFQNVNQMIRVWRNEALRIVSDRLIAEEDKVMKLFSSFPDLLKQRKQV